jgi:hypothetical protein
MIIFTITIYNITIINNDDSRLQDPILLLKIPMGKRKKFSENYRQFGQVLSERLASPALEKLVLA